MRMPPPHQPPSNSPQDDPQDTHLPAARDLPWATPSEALDERIATLLGTDAQSVAAPPTPAATPTPAAPDRFRLAPFDRRGLALAAGLLLVATAGITAAALYLGPLLAGDGTPAEDPEGPPPIAVVTPADPAHPIGPGTLDDPRPAAEPTFESVAYTTRPGPVMRTTTGVPVRPVLATSVTTTTYTNADTGETMEVLTPNNQLVFVEQPVY